MIIAFLMTSGLKKNESATSRIVLITRMSRHSVRGSCKQLPRDADEKLKLGVNCETPKLQNIERNEFLVFILTHPLFQLGRAFVIVGPEFELPHQELEGGGLCD
jgi:hypothetical protein